MIQYGLLSDGVENTVLHITRVSPSMGQHEPERRLNSSKQPVPAYFGESLSEQSFCRVVKCTPTRMRGLGFLPSLLYRVLTMVLGGGESGPLFGGVSLLYLNLFYFQFGEYWTQRIYVSCLRVMEDLWLKDRSNLKLSSF